MRATRRQSTSRLQTNKQINRGFTRIHSDLVLPNLLIRIHATNDQGRLMHTDFNSINLAGPAVLALLAAVFGLALTAVVIVASGWSRSAWLPPREAA